MLRLFSHRLLLVAALFAPVVDASDSLVFPLVYPLFTQKLQFSVQQVAAPQTVGSAASALAAIAGGTLSDRLGRRRTLLVGCVGVAGFDLAFMLCRGLWGSYAFQLGFAATSAIASGVVYASLLALFMDLTHPRLAATYPRVSMALLNLRGEWGSRLGGRLAERVAPTAMFGLGAVVELLPLVLLLWLDPRRAKATFEREDEGN